MQITRENYIESKEKRNEVERKMSGGGWTQFLQGNIFRLTMMMTENINNTVRRNWARALMVQLARGTVGRKKKKKKKNHPGENEERNGSRLKPPPLIHEQNNTQPRGEWGFWFCIICFICRLGIVCCANSIEKLGPCWKLWRRRTAACSGYMIVLDFENAGGNECGVLKRPCFGVIKDHGHSLLKFIEELWRGCSFWGRRESEGKHVSMSAFDQRCTGYDVNWPDFSTCLWRTPSMTNSTNPRLLSV